MAFKILFATDIHLRASRPASRLDKDYMETILSKIGEMCQIAESDEVDLVILGGDLFDNEAAPHSVVIAANRAFKKFKCPVYSIIGNHEIYGYEGKTVDVSSIGSLFEMGWVKRLDMLEISEYSNQFNATNHPNINIYGMHAFDEETWELPDAEGVSILVAHKLITDTRLPDEAGAFMVEDIAKKTNAHVVLSGDMHFPHVVDKEGTLFINSGAISRSSIDDRERQPAVAILTIDSDGSITHEIKTLAHRPAETVLDFKAYSAKLACRDHADERARAFAKVVVSVSSPAEQIGEVFMKFLEENGVAETMKDTLKKYLERGRQEARRHDKG